MFTLDSMIMIFFLFVVAIIYIIILNLKEDEVFNLPWNRKFLFDLDVVLNCDEKVDIDVTVNTYVIKLFIVTILNSFINFLLNICKLGIESVFLPLLVRINFTKTIWLKKLTVHTIIGTIWRHRSVFIFYHQHFSERCFPLILILLYIILFSVCFSFNFYLFKRIFDF